MQPAQDHHWTQACALSLVLALIVSCSSPPPPKRQTAEPQRRSSTEQRPISDTHPYRINDYIIYPVKWQRAEDVAVTIEPLLKARYGPEAQLIVHQPHHKLLHYAPRRDRARNDNRPPR